MRTGIGSHRKDVMQDVVAKWMLLGLFPFGK